jgi:outer membrane immunogenic protein
MKIKSLLLATVSSIAAVGSAHAADLPRKAVPQPVWTSNWGGGYIGGHVGVARLNASCTSTSQGDYTSGYGFCGAYQGGASGVNTDTGFTAGLQAGWNWQAGTFVYGFAVDWTWTDLNRTISASYTSPTSFRAKVDWLASFRGRMGLAVDNTLVYMTAGLAAGRVDHLNSGSAAAGTSGDYGNLKTTKAGWVAGLGVEHKFGPNWSVNAEFLYYDLGRKTASSKFCSNNTCSDGGTYATEFNTEIFTVRVGLNYRFGVGKYPY